MAVVKKAEASTGAATFNERAPASCENCQDLAKSPAAW